MSEFNPDQFLESLEAQPPQTATTPVDTSGFDPDEFLKQVNEEKYGTTGQMIKAGLEGVGRGVGGALFTGAEKALGVKEEDILNREETNPLLAGSGEVVGLVGPALMTGGISAEARAAVEAGTLAADAAKGTGMIAKIAKNATLPGLMGQAGEAAVAATGLGGEAASLASKVGASAVQQATEMAILQSSNEAHKMIINDPNTSAESAIANIGLASALGAGTGAFITGAVSPLWKATAKEPLDKALNSLKSYMNGGKPLSEDLAKASATLGVEIPDVIKGANKYETQAANYSALKRMENPEILNAEAKMRMEASNSVANAMRMAPEDIAVYSENEAGHKLLDKFKEEYKAKYAHFEEAYNKRNEEAFKIAIPDEERHREFEKIIEKGINTVGTDSPYYKEYNEYANRLLAKDTIGDLDKVVTELNGKIAAAQRSGDFNVTNALRDIKTSFMDFQEGQIIKQAKAIGAEMYVDKAALKGVEPLAGVGSGARATRDMLKEEARLAAKEGALEGKGLGASYLNERAELARQYKEFAGMSRELANHLGIGRFYGAKSLEGKLEDSITPEMLLKKFSFKNNADMIPHLQKFFPDTLEVVKENELKQLLKPAVLGAKNNMPLNIKTLSDILEKNMAGKKEYLEAILPPGAYEKVMAAQKLEDAIPKPINSGTPAGMFKNIAMLPASGMGLLAGYLGHNPILGAIAGQMAHYLGKGMPDSIKLGLLKFAASDQPIKAEGFKAAVDMIHNVVKGQNTLVKAAEDVFKSGAKVVAEHNMPSKADNDKLDKIVTKVSENPQALLEMTKGETGHYFPNHQSALTETTTNAINYLAQIKPQPIQVSPLGPKIEPSPTEMARYNRALTIANNPNVVLQHVKDGTLQSTDMQDLQSMYPALYKDMATKVSNQMINKAHSEELIPYKTRMGVSLFLGQPIDTTMTPQSIMSAQPKPVQNNGQNAPKSMKNLGKSTPNYMTPLQQSEAGKNK